MQKKLDTSFGETVWILRIEHGYSQREVASKAGLNSTFISMLERGRRQPSLQTFFDLSYALEIEATELLSLVLQRFKKKASI